ncbi:MAG: site-specific DNA-methyltransferase [Sulfuriferula sp.]|nr:site-specific DNA-methyltransferase [Sulfuriferula sp.]
MTAQQPCDPHELSHSLDLTADVLSQLRTLIPEAFSEGKIDFARLKSALGDDVFTQNEHYELSWAGKTAARREIQKTSSATLTPDTRNASTAAHVLIEGENLEVLRTLQKSYARKVKMIYIDPPYNTGNDSFVYPDDYSETLDEYRKRTGLTDEDGYLNKQTLWQKNSRESGQYHSVWLSMMYPRLYLARNLLRDDGVIFISIDDNEAANLKLLCDEVFGVENFLGNISWIKKSKPINSGRAKYQIQSKIEYILCFCKAKPSGVYEFQLKKDGVREYKHKGKLGLCRLKDILDSDIGMKRRDTMKFPILGVVPPDGQRWKIGIEEVSQLLSSDRIEVIDGKIKVAVYPSDEDSEILKPFWSHIENCGTAENGKNELNEVIEKKIGFDTTKPLQLISELISRVSITNDLILDFFAGSGTTAQAVMELNLEDGGNRRCICVQMPEVLDEKSEAYKAGYRTIADITRARITKVIAKLKAEKPEQTADLACAHFKLTPSHFKAWRADVSAADLEKQLEIFQNAEKSTSTHANMLAELLLKMGLGLVGVDAITKPVTIAGCEIQRVLLPDNRLLWVCFATYLPPLKAEIVKAKPHQVLMLNSCFTGDKADEQLTNLQLELDAYDIRLTVI